MRFKGKHMAQPIAELENAASLRHHRLEWKMERLGWTVMLLIIVGALAGLFGPGPLTTQERSTGDGALAIEYHAVEHNAAPGRLIIRVRQVAEAKTLRLNLSRSFSDHATTESIVPSPLSAEARDDAVVYTFAAHSPDGVVLTYRYQYDSIGVFDHQVALNGGESIRFRQYVLP
jgi:hypothetical protein